MEDLICPVCEEEMDFHDDYIVECLNPECSEYQIEYDLYDIDYDREELDKNKN